MRKLLKIVVRIFIALMSALALLSVTWMCGNFGYYMYSSDQIEFAILLIIVFTTGLSILFYRIIPFGKDK